MELGNQSKLGQLAQGELLWSAGAEGGPRAAREGLFLRVMVNVNSTLPSRKGFLKCIRVIMSHHQLPLFLVTVTDI